MSNGHEYSADYFAERDRSPTFHLEHEAFRRSLRETGTLGGRILEVGAGAGSLGRALAMDAGMWVATDLNPAPLAGAASGRVHPVACDATRLPFGSGGFAAVVAQHVIEHFEDPVGVLRAWVEVIRPGGVCIVTTPNRAFPHQHWFEDPTHYELFTAERLSRSLQDAGLESVRVMPLIPWLGSARAVFLSARLQRRFLGIRIPGKRSLNLMAIGRVPG